MVRSRTFAPLVLFGMLAVAMAAGTCLPQSRGVSATNPPPGSGMYLAWTDGQTAKKTDRKSGPAYQLEKVKEWQTLAAQHSSGMPDASAVAVGGWHTQDVEIVLDYVTKLASQPKRAIQRALSKTRLQRLFDLTDQEAQQGDLNRILKQGVLLHTDIALLDLEKWEFQHLREGVGAFADGHTYLQPKKHHWEFARRLVDCVAPISSQNALAKEWYVATTAHMESRRLLGYAGQNLKSALEKFPKDFRILFYAGALHEAWAAPVNQNIILPKGGKTSYGSGDSELKLARQFYENAIESNPSFSEARLRLGRVLGLLGDHQQAALELQQAQVSMQDSQLLYYASLYLGREFEALSRRNEARSQYERAATLCPTAQVPLLSLSHLAHSSGDTAGALLAVQRMFALPREDSWQDDPWWVYDIAHVRDAGAFIEELHKLLGRDPR